MKRQIMLILLLILSLPALPACGASAAAPEPEAQTEEVTEMTMHLKIGDTAVETAWENNASVEALKVLCADEPLVVEMSMYGGFEQVGSIGKRLPRSDVQITTKAGDLVLYSGNQLVVFYGSNSWAYTRLGHITDRSAKEMAELLGSGDVTITISPGPDK